MNKIILSFINNFMVEHQEEIVEVITDSNSELYKKMGGTRKFCKRIFRTNGGRR